MADAIVTVEYDGLVKVTQTLDTGIANVTDLNHEIKLPGLAGTLSPTTTVPCSAAWTGEITMSGGTQSLDLSALTRGNLGNVNGGSGSLKVQLFILLNDTTSSAGATILAHAVEGYDVFGSGGTVVVPVGGFIMWFGNENMDDIVTDTNDIIQITGTNTDTYKSLIVMG